MSYFPQRVICLTEETVEVLYDIGAQDRIVGISGFAMRPLHARKEKPKVSTYLDAKFDEILALKPDVVFAWSDLQADICAELIRRGIEVLCFNQRSISGILEMVVRLCAYMGVNSDMYLNRLCSSIEAAKVRGTNRVHKPRVYFEEWYDPLITGICWVSECIELCGGIDVFSENRIHQGAKERILHNPLLPVARNPDIMIASWCGKMFKPNTVRARAGWENFLPILNNQVFEIHSSIILQPGPAVLTDGLEALLNIFDSWEHSHLPTSPTRLLSV